MTHLVFENIFFISQNHLSFWCCHYAGQQWYRFKSCCFHPYKGTGFCSEPVMPDNHILTHWPLWIRGDDFESVISAHLLQIEFTWARHAKMRSEEFYRIPLVISKLVQLIAWYCQATGHYLANDDSDLWRHFVSIGQNVLSWVISCNMVCVSVM